MIVGSARGWRSIVQSKVESAAGGGLEKGKCQPHGVTGRAKTSGRPLRLLETFSRLLRWRRGACHLCCQLG